MGAEQLDAADSLQSRLIMALAMAQFRKERDLLGEREVAAEALHGVHTERALENFPLSGRRVHPELIHAYGAVKLACARTNHGTRVIENQQ